LPLPFKERTANEAERSSKEGGRMNCVVCDKEIKLDPYFTICSAKCELEFWSEEEKEGEEE